MVNVSQDWKTFESKVKFSFNDEDNTVFETTGSDRIIQVDINEEINNNRSDPIGKISSNTISIKLLDEDHEFDGVSWDSPYAGLLNTGFKINYYIKIDDGNFEECGEFFMTDIISSNTSFNTTVIKGAGILNFVLNRPINIVNIEKDVKVKDFIIKIFNSVGVETSKLRFGYGIDYLDNIKYTYTFGNKLKDILNDLQISNTLFIYEGRDGLIDIIGKEDLMFAYPEYDIKSDQNLISVEKENSSILDTFNKIKVTYNETSFVKSEKLLSIDKLTLKPGLNKLEHYRYGDNIRVTGLDYISINSKKSDALEYSIIDSSQYDISLSITNSGSENIDVKLEVYGGCIHGVEATAEADYSYGVNYNVDKYYNIDAKLIQNYNQADSLARDMAYNLNIDNRLINIVANVNPLLYIGSVVYFRSNLLNLGRECLVNRINLSVGSSYSCKLNLMNKDIFI